MSLETEDIPNVPKSVVLTPLDRPTRQGLRLQHIMYAVGVLAFVFWFATILGIWLLTGSFLLLIAGAVGIGVVLVRRSSTQQESLLWALAIAAERSLPLAPAALAFADQYGRSFRGRVQLLASLLSEGLTLPEAIDQVPGLISREAEILVRTGWSTGTLARSLREAAGARALRQAAWGTVAWRFLYVGLVFLWLQIIMGFLTFFIAPKFEAIFRDFGLALPKMTVILLEMTHFAMQFKWPLLLPLVIEAVLLFLLPFGIFNLFEWDVPLLDFLFRRRHSSLLLRALALNVEGGKPIAAGIEALSRDYPSRWVRRRLRRVNEEVQNGLDWVESLEAHHLIRPSESAVIAASQRVGNLGWALREMAEANERKLGYRLQFWLQTLFPVVMFGVGALVFMMAVAYFSPLVKLIEVLAR